MDGEERLNYILKRYARLSDKIKRTQSALAHVKQIGDEATVDLLSRSLRSSKNALKRWEKILETDYVNRHTV